MAGPMGPPAMISYGYGQPVVYHPGYAIRGGFAGGRGRAPPFLSRGAFNGGRGAYGGRGPYGGRGMYMGEGGMPERRPPPGTPGISSGFQARLGLLVFDLTSQVLFFLLKCTCSLAAPTSMVEAHLARHGLLPAGAGASGLTGSRALLARMLAAAACAGARPPRSRAACTLQG
jgi:hypothetical protein